jgi:epoxyqueuosine reductase
MPGVIERLYSHLEQQGLKARVVSIDRLDDLRREIEDRHAQGQFDPDFYQVRLDSFSFTPPDDLPDAASLIVVAMPRPQHQAHFTWHGATRSLIIPPTYVGYERIGQRMRDLLSAWLAPEGYRIARPRLPLKALAVRSGLAEYGRNNVAYVAGMGSFHQLAAVYSDLPCPEDGWREPRMMDRCQKCQACRHACPTAAIPSDRFLLRAERCITFLNERPTGVPFPDWIDPAWHNCLVGCMHCQRACPETIPFLNWIEGGDEFSHDETALLLAGAARDQLPPATLAKLERLDLLDSLDVLPRNLGVFFPLTP